VQLLNFLEIPEQGPVANEEQGPNSVQNILDDHPDFAHLVQTLVTFSRK
jgi:hypothetical protein